MMTIPLTQGKVALVDDEKYEELNQHKWCADKKHGSWYAFRGEYNSSTKKIKKIKMHRQLMNFPHGFIDHKNRNGLDNRIENLRICNHSMNRANSKLNKNNKTGFRGVSLRKDTMKFTAKIGRKKIGCFCTPEDAAKAYDKKAKELFGDFSTLNFPNEDATVNRQQSTANEGGGMVNG